MIRLNDEELETAIRAALCARAEAFAPPQTVFLAKRRTSRLVVRSLAVAAAVIIGAVVVWTAVSGRSKPHAQVATGDPTHVQLRAVSLSTDERRTLLSIPEFVDPKSVFFQPRLVALRADNEPKLVIAFAAEARNGYCAYLLVPTDSGLATPASGCADPNDPSKPVISGDADTPVTYLAWIGLPDGTASITLDSIEMHRVERPVSDMAAFVIPAAHEILTVRALAADGNELARAVIPRDDFPDGSISTRPPWWDLDASLRWCDSARIGEVAMNFGSIGGRFRMIDPGNRAPGTGGFIDIDARTSCRLRTPQEPPESGTIRADLHVVNGSLKVLYYERAAAGADRRVLLSPGISFTPEVNGAQIPDVEAVARTAADRARLTRLCAGHPERIRTKPECGTR